MRDRSQRMEGAAALHNLSRDNVSRWLASIRPLSYDVRVPASSAAWWREEDGDDHGGRHMNGLKDKSATPDSPGRSASGQQLIQVFDLLRSAYGPQNWWPADTPLEVIVGAVLTQNTAWHNVALAIANLKREGLLEPGLLFRAETERVKALIRPAGYYNVKYERLMNLLRYLDGYGMDLAKLRGLPLSHVREELLEVKGVGPETADSILLYALQRPVFVVDAFTRRLFSRLGFGWMGQAPYDEVQRFFMEALPPDLALYNESHALIVVHSKNTCKKRPRCVGCCLSSLCAERQEAR
jgi:endonuclease-3 related protein